MTKVHALRCYAAMMNTLDINKLERFLAPDFCYSSQWVFDEITSKQGYLDYMEPKLGVIQSSGSIVFAEMGEIKQAHPIGPCVLVAQNMKENLVATVLAEVKGEFIQRLDMYLIPTVQSVTRSGFYPKN
jgi:hypothetical protein